MLLLETLSRKITFDKITFNKVQANNNHVLLYSLAFLFMFKIVIILEIDVQGATQLEMLVAPPLGRDSTTNQAMDNLTSHLRHHMLQN